MKRIAIAGLLLSLGCAGGLQTPILGHQYQHVDLEFGGNHAVGPADTYRMTGNSRSYSGSNANAIAVDQKNRLFWGATLRFAPVNSRPCCSSREPHIPTVETDSSPK